MKGVVCGAMWIAVAWTGTAMADWTTPVGGNVVADGVVAGGGYPDPPGSTKPQPGTCGPGLYNANRSESWIAVRPGTESLVGVSKIFFENFSTFYDFHLGAYAITNGAVTGQSQVQGYDCVSPPRRRCRRAGRTTPIRTPTSTRRGASTRQRCRSTPSGAAASTPTAPSTSPTPTPSACTGRRATAAPISSRTTTRRASAPVTWRTRSGSRSTTSQAAGTRIT